MLKLASCNDFVGLRRKYRDLYAGYGYDWSLKEFGSLFIYDHIVKSGGRMKVCEFGPGFNVFFSSKLSTAHEYWSIDDSGSNLGIGADAERYQKVVKTREENGHRHVAGLLGANSSDLPSDHFDVVFSISVIEHIAGEDMGSVATEAYRILRKGGVLINTIDIYFGSKKHAEWRDAAANAGFQMPAKIENDWKFGGNETTFLERQDVRYVIYNSLKHPKIWDDDVPYVSQFATVCQRAAK